MSASATQGGHSEWNAEKCSKNFLLNSAIAVDFNVFSNNNDRDFYGRPA